MHLFWTGSCAKEYQEVAKKKATFSISLEYHEGARDKDAVS